MCEDRKGIMGEGQVTRQDLRDCEMQTHTAVFTCVV